MSFLTPDGVATPAAEARAAEKTGMVCGETPQPELLVPPFETLVSSGGEYLTRTRLEAGALALVAARAVVAVREAGGTFRQAAMQVGISLPRAHRLAQHWASLPPEGRTAAAFAPRPSGPERQDPLPDTTAVEVRRLLAITNRDKDRGSRPEALREAAKRGLLSAEMESELKRREAAGLPLTRAMIRQLRQSPAEVHATRNPRDAWLRYVSSEGSLQMTTDAETGKERDYEPGEAWTIDDGTYNFICCVPTTDPQWKSGWMPGRFQILLAVDHRSYFPVGFTHTARPKGSYRAEDILATLHTAMREHGAPPQLILERGISAADKITRCCQHLGITIDRAFSPHRKVVEMVFGCLWTKLSFLPGQVGRYQGENAAVDALYRSYLSNKAKDPRTHFAPLADTLRAIREGLHDWGQHHVNSDQYGKWQPAEYFAREAGKQLRPLADAHDWMFYPHVTEPLKVSKMHISTSVLLGPGFSQKYSFTADWLARWIGARVRLHFHPFADLPAKAVLDTPFAGEREGAVLGDLVMFNRHTRHTLRGLGYAFGEDIGHEATRRQSQALHRVAVALRPDGKAGRTAVEVRDGLGRTGPVDTAAASAAPAAESAPQNRMATRAIEPEMKPDARLAEFLEDEVAA